MSIGAGPHPWKPVPDGSTPICDALITDWLATHRQHFPGEPQVKSQPKIKPVLTPLLDAAVKENSRKVNAMDGNGGGGNGL